MYLVAASTISHQPTYKKSGYSLRLQKLNKSSNLLHPDYSLIIPANKRRRMSEAIKMSIACTADVLEQGSIAQPDAIIVGTGLGCSQFTKTFLDKISASENSAISPSSFMLSTHNTMAGQISLYLKNHNYNMTHTHNSLSFEYALLDGILSIREGCDNVLVGGVDEDESLLFNMGARLHMRDVHVTGSASFFLLTKEAHRGRAIRLVDVSCQVHVPSNIRLVMDFLQSHNISAHNIHAVLFATFDDIFQQDLTSQFSGSHIIDYQELSGVHFTSSAFALGYALDIASVSYPQYSGTDSKGILICNNMIKSHLGLVLVNIS